MNEHNQLSRRSLIQGTAAIGALAALGATRATAKSIARATPLKKGATIVFQGDSITDEGRKKEVEAANDSTALGRGYAAMISGLLLGNYTDLELKCYNRGISGNKIPDLAARWQKDVIDLKPDVLSILIGINDIWHTIAFGAKYQATIKDYEEGYRALLKQTQDALPNCRIVICEPFTTRDNFKSKEGKSAADYAVVARKIADDLKLTFVPFQSTIDQACKAAEAKFWLWDGIHPSTAGHALMAQAWREAVGI